MARAANPALQKPMQLSPELEAVVGEGPLTRAEVTKKIWDYIKEKNLQNPSNKRNVLADDKLRAAGGDQPSGDIVEMAQCHIEHDDR